MDGMWLICMHLLVFLDLESVHAKNLDFSEVPLNIVMSEVSTNPHSHLFGLSNNEEVVQIEADNVTWQGLVLENQGVYYLVGDESRIGLHLNFSASQPSSGVPTTNVANTTNVRLTLTNSSWNTQLHAFTKTNSSWIYRIGPTDLKISTIAYSPREPWTMNLEVEHESGRFSQTYTLIHLSSVPVLNWKLSDQLVDFAELEISDLQVASVVTHPCNSLVTLVTLHNRNKGEIYLGLNALSYNNSQWYNLTANLQNTLGAKVKDTDLFSTIMVNSYLLVLTSAGLMRSNDLKAPLMDKLVKWTRVLDLRHYTKPEAAELTYSPECLWRQHDLRISDLVVLSRTFEAQDGERTTISYYSSWDYTKWNRLATYGTSYIFNAHMITMATLIQSDSQNSEIEVYVLDENFKAHDQKLVPPFVFPKDVNITSIMAILPSQSIYALGNQVWVSEDGGNRFEKIHTFDGDTATDMTVGKSSLIVQTEKGLLYYGKIGIPRLVKLGRAISDESSWVSFDRNEDLYVAQLGIQSSAVFVQSERIDVQLAVQSNQWDINRPLLLEIKSPRDVYLYEHIPLSGLSDLDKFETPFFKKQHLGLKFKLSGGAGGFVTHIDNPRDLAPGFLMRVAVRMDSPFPVVPQQSGRDVYNYILYVEPYNHTTGLARLWLREPGTEAVADKWTTAEVGQTVVIPNSCSYLILSKESDRSVIGQSAVLANTVVKRSPGAWIIVDIRENKWFMKEAECTQPVVNGNNPPSQKYFELDIEDTLTLSAHINTRGSALKEDLPKLFATLTNPWVLSFKPSLEKDRTNYMETLSMQFTPRTFHKGTTAVRIHKTHAGLLCEQPLLIFVIHVGCPCTKRLVSLYPTTVSREAFLGVASEEEEKQIVTLPTNYRPPSKLGVDIPLSGPIYNSDPSQPRPRNRYTVSKRSGHFGICEGKRTREQCGCTDEMKLVYLPEYSDCVERVYMLPHPGYLPLKLYFEQLGKPSVPLDARYIITVNEINDRMPLVTEGTASEFLQLLRNNSDIPHARSYYSAADAQLTMNGSGIYHVDIKLAPKQSFCNLSSYILVYVDQTPIAYPLNYVTNYTTTVLLGWVLLGLYVRFLMKFHTHVAHKSGSRCRESPMVDKVGKHHHLVE